MKIIMDRFGNNTKVLTDEGVDITRELAIKEVVVQARLNEIVEATLVCDLSHADLTLLPEGVAVIADEGDKT